MKKKEFKTVGEYFYWQYANLSMAHVALKNQHKKYERTDFMIRAKLYKGFITGTHSISSIYSDEKEKLKAEKCCYCGKRDFLTLDHLISRYYGGNDCGDNFVYACKSCNSSKNKKDLLVWYMEKQAFPPILVLRRYLKLTYIYLSQNNYMNLPIEKLEDICGIFKIDLLPYEYPQPEELML